MIGEKNEFNNCEITTNLEQENLKEMLIAEKILICRAATIEQFGSINAYKAVKNLYTALYYPEKINTLISPNEKYPDRMDVLSEHLDFDSVNIPEEGEFIQAVRRAMTKGVDFDKSFSQESREQFYNILKKSELTVIWTDGDAFGVPEHDLPGSCEQISRVAAAKFFNQMRREVALDRGVDHKDILSVCATERKIEVIPGLIEKFKNKNIDKVIIVEDRIKNLEIFMSFAQQEDSRIDFIPILIGEQKLKKDSMIEDKFLKNLYVIGNISELGTILEDRHVFSEDKKVGAIFDMDGVLSDDNIRRELQIKSIISVLRLNNWI